MIKTKMNGLLKTTFRLMYLKIKISKPDSALGLDIQFVSFLEWRYHSEI